MAEEEVITPNEENIENTNTDETVKESENTEEVKDNEPEDTSESNDDELTDEELENMSDDDFVKYLDSGKRPRQSTPKEDKSDKVEERTEEVVKTPSKSHENASKIDSNKKDEQSTIPNYEEAYKAIFKPFRANGKDITPRNVDDVVSLMQMGANYTKKMQAMAPMKKAVETLNKANIDINRLNFLIDVNNGDPEAIKQLLKDKKIDPIEMDLETTNYVPRNNIASDEDVEFNDMLSDIEDSLPAIQEVFSTWDPKSKEMCLKDNNLMRSLAEEVRLDRFPKIKERLEIEKTFGRYKGVPDIVAYTDVLRKTVPQQSTQATSQPVQTPTQPKKQVSDKSRAAPTRAKAKANKSNLTPNDIFSMSEEEFNKLSINDLV